MESKITVAAKSDELKKVHDFVNGVLKKNNFQLKIIMQIEIAVEELFVNIVSYAYPQNVRTKEAIVQIGCQMISHNQVEITFADYGIPFNPLKKSDPDISLPAEKRDIGGLGIYMVRKSMDNMSYVRIGNQNLIKIYKSK